MKRFWLALSATVLLFVAAAVGGYIAHSRDADASRNSAGTMSAVNGPYVPSTVINSAQINSRYSDIESELTNSLDRSGRGGMLAALRGVDGTVGAPAFSYTSETGSGEYRIGASDLGWAVSGVKKLELTSSLFTVSSGVNLGIGVSGTASVHAARSDGAYQYKIERNGGTDNQVYGIAVDGTAGSPSFLIDDITNGANRFRLTKTGAVTIAGATTLSGGVTVGASGTAISASFRGTTSFNPGSGTLNSLVCASTTIALTGSVAGADCDATGPSSGLDTLILRCWVTTDTCNVRVCNPTAGAATTSSQTYACRVFNP